MLLSHLQSASLDLPISSSIICYVPNQMGLASDKDQQGMKMNMALSIKREIDRRLIDRLVILEFCPRKSSRIFIRIRSSLVADFLHLSKA